MKPRWNTKQRPSLQFHSTQALIRTAVYREMTQSGRKIMPWTIYKGLRFSDNAHCTYFSFYCTWFQQAYCQEPSLKTALVWKIRKSNRYIVRQPQKLQSILINRIVQHLLARLWSTNLSQSIVAGWSTLCLQGIPVQRLIKHGRI